MLQTLMLNGYNKTLHIYGPKGTKKMMQLYLALFTHKHKISIKVNEITKNKVLETSDFRIIAEQMKHETPALAYSFEIKEKIRLNKAKLAKLKLGKGKHFQDLAKGKTIKIKNKAINPKSLNLIYKEPERKLTIIMDTLENSNTIKLAKNSDVLICESTYSKKEEKLAKEHFHLTSNQSAQIAKKAKTKSLYLVHLSQRYDKDNKEILKQAKKIFKNTKIPEDFNEIVF